MPDYLTYQLTNDNNLLSEIADIANYDNIFVTDQRLEQIKRETATDIILQTLMNAIHTGWPDDKMKTPLVLRPYWVYRYELIASNGLVFRGMRLVIPTSMIPEMVTRDYASHMGTEYTANTAREVM